MEDNEEGSRKQNSNLDFRGLYGLLTRYLAERLVPGPRED
jgi:hypothetical protein